MTQDEVKNNLLAPAQWLRMLIMAGFVLAAWVVWMVLVVVMITQTVTVLITGEPNINLKRFGRVTSAYMQEIISFLVYSTEARPFPFAPFPEYSVTVNGAGYVAEPGTGPRQTEASATVHTAPVTTPPVYTPPVHTPPAQSFADDSPPAYPAGEYADAQTTPPAEAWAPEQPADYAASAFEASPTYPAADADFETRQQADLAAADSEPFPYDLDSDPENRNKD